MNLPRWVLVLIFALVAAPGAPAQTKAAGTNKLTIEDVVRWRIASEPVVSPDGKRVAFLVSENDLEKSRTVTQVWWVETETRQARRLTQTQDSVGDPRWSPDGRWLAFLAVRDAQAEGEGERKRKAQVWLLPVSGGEAFALTKATEGVQQYRWAPDGKAVYYVAREPVAKPAETLREQQQKRKADAIVVDEEKYRREIWRVTIESGKAERIFAGDPGLAEIEPSPDGKWLVYRTNYTGELDHARKFDLWLLNMETRRARQLTRRDGEERSPAWSPDSTRVAFLASRMPGINYSQEEVWAVPVASEGEPQEPQRLSKDFAGNIERLHWPGKSADIFFAAGVQTGNRLFRLSPADGSVRPVSTEGLFFTQPDWTADGTSCAAIAEGPDSLPDVFLLRSAETLLQPQRMTELNPQLKNFALGAQEIIRWKSKDGLEIEGILITPPGWQPTQKYPLLLEIHGGPYDRRANTLTSGHAPQVWAAQGWLVLQPNFRGSSAYGHDFGVANRGDLGGKDFEDILAGVDYVVAQGWADEERMAVLGGSYGGYMTNLIIARTKRFRAAVSLYGIFNLITDYSNSDFPSWETDYLTQYYWENLQAYVERSPFKDVTQITTPVLIMHGEADNNTFISNSKEMYQALKALGRKAKFVRFPREGHGINEPSHLLEMFRQMQAWLDEHALGAAETRSRAVGEAVRKDGWELKVAGVRTPESYAGVKPKGCFVEVEVLIRAALATEERFSLLVFDTAGSEIHLVAGARNIYPVGVAAESLGQRVLLKSSGQVVAFVPDRDGQHTALALAVVFDVPVGERELLLKVKEFPAVQIQLPIEVK